MKITQLFKIYWPDNGGGIASVMENIAAEFSDCEQEIIVCHASKKKEAADDIYKGIAIHRCRQLFQIASTPISTEFLYEVKKRTKDSDIVLYHFPYPMADAAILLGLYSGKVVVWWHCGFEKYKRLALLYRLLVKRTLEKADLILVSSIGNIEHTAILKPYKKKCRVIPYCVDDAYIKKGKKYAAETDGNNEQIHYKCGCSQQNEIRILFIGRLVWYKGCDVLLSAFAKIQDLGCRLVIVGSGPLEKKLKKLAASLKLVGVEFTGMVSEEEKMRQLAACDFLVLPSVSKAEAFAIVQLEAMAFGKPVINTALQSGVPYVSVNGVTGRTVKPGSVGELAEAMKELAGNELLRREYGKNARKKVQEMYTQKAMAERYRMIFRHLLSDT